MNIKKIAILAAIVAAIVLFKALNLSDYLTLSYLKESREKFHAVYSSHRALVLAGYMLLYILVTSLSLPGAAVMSLAGGAMFGLLTGTVVVSFASSIGATLACFVSRFLLRDWVQGRFGEKLKAVNRGVEREGAFYLFTLRLIPVFPFWMINLVMGLTGLRLFTFYWVSQLGMLPGTVVYVNAGRELGRIESVSGILSPGVIISFVLLGVFPIVVKRLLRFYRGRKGKPQIG